MYAHKRRHAEKRIRGRQSVPVTEDTPLTVVEQEFITQYLKTGSIKEAIKRADPYPHVNDGACSTAGKTMLARPNVQKELRRIMEELKKESVATAEEVMLYFTAVMRGEVKDQFGLDAPLSERTRAAQEIAKRTIDIDNRAKLREAEENQKPIQVTLNWAKPEDN